MTPSRWNHFIVTSGLFGPPLVLIGGFLAYALFLVNHIGAYAGGSDSSGYLNSARLFGLGRLSETQRTWPGLPQSQFAKAVYVPLGFRVSSENEIVPTYPIGVPLLVMATSQVVGWNTGPPLVILLHSLVGVCLQWWLGRCAGLSWGWAALGALLLACCPLYVVYSLQMMSDVPATTWALATVTLALHARKHSGWAVGAGAAFAMAVLIRPTNIILFLPAAIALNFGWRRWISFVIGIAPGALVQLLYNHSVYGNFFMSGYGNVSSMFRWEYVPLSLATYRQWLPILLTPVGLLACALPFFARKNMVLTMVLIAWIFAFFSLYAFYFHTHETWWYLRFLLPAFPAVWIAAILVIRNIAQGSCFQAIIPSGSLRSWIVGGLLVTILLGFDYHWNRVVNSKTAGEGERAYLEAIEWMRPQVPNSALLIAMQASGALAYYTDFPVLRWDRLEPMDFRQVEKAAVGRSVFAFLQPFEEERAFQEKVLNGRWIKIGTSRNFSLWQFEVGSSQEK